MGRLGPQELIVILVIVLIIFGPSRLPQFGKSMGEAVKEWKKVRKEVESLHDEHL